MKERESILQTAWTLRVIEHITIKGFICKTAVQKTKYFEYIPNVFAGESVLFVLAFNVLWKYSLFICLSA